MPPRSKRNSILNIEFLLAISTSLIRELALPVGTAVSGAFLIAKLVSPRWRAGGAPYVFGYAKNVEVLAAIGGILVGAMGRAIALTRTGSCTSSLIALFGWYLIATRCLLEQIAGCWARFLFIAFLFIPLHICWPEDDEAFTAQTAETRASAKSVLAFISAGLLSVLAFASCRHQLDIDVFHHGEILASAIDLLHGGRPFSTFIWPHGFHDTGLTALWILATGKIGTSPVSLARSSCYALGIISGFLLGKRLLASRSQSLAVCMGLLVVALQEDFNVLSSPVYHLGVLIFVVSGFYALTSVNRNRELIAGVCIGLSYVFRIETGAFAATAALGLIVFQSAIRDRGSLGEGGKVLAKSCVSFVCGMLLPLVLLYLLLGWPDHAWFEYTLLELPKYHLDAVGLPFPWPIRGLRSPSTLNVRASLPCFFLF